MKRKNFPGRKDNRPEKSLFIGNAHNLREAIIPVLRLCVPHLCHLPPQEVKDHGVHIIYQTCTKPAGWTKPRINITSEALTKKQETNGPNAQPWKLVEMQEMFELLRIKQSYSKTQHAAMRRHIKSNTHQMMYLIGFLQYHHYMVNNACKLFLSPPYRIESGFNGKYNWHIRVFFNASLRASGAGMF